MIHWIVNKYARLLFLTLYPLLVPALVRASEIKFFDLPGIYPVPNSGKQIVVTNEGSMVQFRIRGAGPIDPIIKADSPWFIAMLDPDHYWVYLGGDRFFHYSWLAQNQSEIDEWHYSREGNAPIPKEVVLRMQQSLARSR